MQQAVKKIVQGWEPAAEPYLQVADEIERLADEFAEQVQALASERAAALRRKAYSLLCSDPEQESGRVM